MSRSASSDTRPESLVVLGIGNVLMQDEGVGVHVARELAARPLPPHVRVVDGGTLGIELLPVVQDAAGIVLIDAARFAGDPGEVRAFRGDALAGNYGGHLSPHQAGAGDLIAVARLTGSLPARCTLFGVQPQDVDFGLELSGTVAAAVPALIEAVLAELRSFSPEVAHA